MPDHTHKRCPMCGQTKPRSEFTTRRWFDRKRQRTCQKLAAWCAPCYREYYRQRHAYRQRTDPAYREQRRRYAKLRWRRHREERAEACRWLLRAAQRHIAALRERGWTGARIASELGVSRATVSGWARGLWAPRPAHLRALRRLAETLGEADWDVRGPHATAGRMGPQHRSTLTGGQESAL